MLIAEEEEAAATAAGRAAEKKAKARSHAHAKQAAAAKYGKVDGNKLEAAAAAAARTGRHQGQAESATAAAVHGRKAAHGPTQKQQQQPQEPVNSIEPFIRLELLGLDFSAGGPNDGYGKGRDRAAKSEGGPGKPQQSSKAAAKPSPASAATRHEKGLRLEEVQNHQQHKYASRRALASAQGTSRGPGWGVNSVQLDASGKRNSNQQQGVILVREDQGARAAKGAEQAVRKQPTAVARRSVLPTANKVLAPAAAGEHVAPAAEEALVKADATAASPAQQTSPITPAYQLVAAASNLHLPPPTIVQQPTGWQGPSRAAGHAPATPALLAGHAVSGMSFPLQTTSKQITTAAESSKPPFAPFAGVSTPAAVSTEQLISPWPSSVAVQQPDVHFLPSTAAVPELVLQESISAAASSRGVSMPGGPLPNFAFSGYPLHLSMSSSLPPTEPLSYPGSLPGAARPPPINRGLPWEQFRQHGSLFSSTSSSNGFLGSGAYTMPQIKFVPVMQSAVGSFTTATTAVSSAGTSSSSSSSSARTTVGLPTHQHAGVLPGAIPPTAAASWVEIYTKKPTPTAAAATYQQNGDASECTAFAVMPAGTPPGMFQTPASSQQLTGGATTTAAAEAACTALGATTEGAFSRQSGLTDQRELNRTCPQDRGGDASKGRSRRSKKANRAKGELCVVCWEDSPCVVLLPCRHMVLCEECSELLESKGADCPTCRATVDERVVALQCS